MIVQTYITPGEFLKDTGLFLTSNEAENNLILGIGGSGRYSRYILAAVKQNGKPVLAALMTPPHNMILTDGPSEAVSVLADYVEKEGIHLPGLIGPADVLRLFAEESGRKYRVAMKQLIYECSGVVCFEASPGRMRAACREDASLLVEWMIGFHADAGLTEPVETITENVLKQIENLQIVLWEDGQPVSMALSTGKTPHGIRVGAVYTPPEFRKHGYAASNVAALTQKLLDEGNEFCFLYTDRANPVSNSIYRKIGYRQIAESQMIRFD